MKTHLLIDEPPLQVLPSLAVAIGLEEAIFVQQLHYWLSNPKSAGRIDENGVKWVYNTYAEWHDLNFPFWNEDKIQRVILNAEKVGVVISAQLDAKKHDMRKFYRIDYDAICALHNAILRPSNNQKTPPSNGAKSHDDNKELTEITPETTTPARTPVVHDLEVQDSYVGMVSPTVGLPDSTPKIDLITQLLVEAAKRDVNIDLDGYPEDVVLILLEFCRLYHFSPPAINSNRTKVKREGRSGFWIMGARELNEACGEFGILALRRQRVEFENYMSTHSGLAPFEVVSPKSLVNACAGVAAKMREWDEQRGNTVQLEIKED